ncbi:MAG: hypothetical protein M1828_002438 [Chrysothrix sp. TS-e1954]|nr:MAG: hypothetical protein M1828_002438 [Chrysothrix sp. TS-e1954]
MSFSERKPDSPIWRRAIHNALARYRDDLQETEDYEAIIESETQQDILRFAESIKALPPQEQNGLSSMRRLAPILKSLDDLTAILAVCFGADAKITAVLWGSMRLIVDLASTSTDVFRNVLDMLEELSLTLPKFRMYEETLPMDGPLEDALLDLYTEIICFYARSIHFFRSHPHAPLRRSAWPQLQQDFTLTIRRIKHKASVVETEAELSRMRTQEKPQKEALDVLQDIRRDASAKVKSFPCNNLPSSLNRRLWYRDDVMNDIDAILDPGISKISSKIFALHGIGGVGKTEVALNYAISACSKFDAVLWAKADTETNLYQSFVDVAKVLGLIRTEAELQDSTAALLKVKSWLHDTKNSWLLVFDNCEDMELLKNAWPGQALGSILVTSRSATIAKSLICPNAQIQPFSKDIGASMLMRLTSLDPNNPVNREEAERISDMLGGLAIALVQIGAFISQRQLPIANFIPLYQKNSARIDARKTFDGDYEHTVSTVWELALSKLSGDAKCLQELLAFLDPNAIDEAILLEGSAALGCDEVDFLNDAMDLGDAEEALLRTALIEKDQESGVLSIHRLVQAAVMRRLSIPERTERFDTVTRLLTWGFPDRWSQDDGHQRKTWSRCERCLPHVLRLAHNVTEYKIQTSDSQAYAELLLRCCWFLYEKESYGVARHLVETALANFVDKTSLAYASAIDLSGLILLDLSEPKSALKPFEQAMQVRRQVLEEEDPLIAFSLNNLALVYTETSDFEQAYAIHEKAIKIRLNHQSNRIGNSYSNMARLLLRMGRADEAEEMLRRCPSLKDFTDETFLSTDNPRFSGDMVLLSRIRIHQGHLDDAMRLASKALSFRRKLLGNRLKTCDSLYDLAGIMERYGNLASAASLLLELVTIAETLPEAQGHLARAYFKLSQVYHSMQKDEESNACLATANQRMLKLRPEETRNTFEEQDFQNLCPWMLW